MFFQDSLMKRRAKHLFETLMEGYIYVYLSTVMKMDVHVHHGPKILFLISFRYETWTINDFIFLIIVLKIIRLKTERVLMIFKHHRVGAEFIDIS